MLGMMGGVRIIEDPALTNQVEDWRQVRSPGRAARRRASVSRRGRPKRSHRQNIRIVHVPKTEVFMLDGGRTMVMHPAIAARLDHWIKHGA